MPSPVADAILTPSSPKRSQIDIVIAATNHPSTARNPRRAPSLDSFRADAIYCSSSDPGRSASAPAKLDMSLHHHSPLLVRHSCVSLHSQYRMPCGASTHSQPATSLPLITRGTASDPRTWQDISALHRPPNANLSNHSTSRPIQPESSDRTWLPSGLGPGPGSTSASASIPFSSSSTSTATLNQAPGVPDNSLSVSRLGCSAGFANPDLECSYPGLSLSPGPGPVLVSRPAPPTSTPTGLDFSHRSAHPASIRDESAFSAPRFASPPHFEPGIFSSSAFPAAASVPPLGPVSPLHLSASVTPLPALTASVSRGTAASPQAESDTVESLRQQLSFLVQAWMADRESSRLAKQQTDEVLQRMRVAMESGREQWTKDRAAMERDLESLSAEVHRLKQENATLKAAATRTKRRHGAASPEAGRRRDPARTGNSSPCYPDHPMAASLSSNPSQQSGSSRACIFSPPPGFENTPRRTHFVTPGSSRTSPSGPPRPAHVGPLDPRSQPRHSVAVDFMDPLARNGKAPPPIIDVQEIDPQLEGIPLRANAVKRSTFIASMSHPSLTVFTRRSGEGRDSAATRRVRRLTPTRNLSVDRSKFWRLRRKSSKDQTLQMLATEESRRLTMHAGHTPNHSLSLLPTMTITGDDSTGCESMQAISSAETRSVCADHDELVRSAIMGSEQRQGTDAEQDQSAFDDGGEGLADLDLELLEDNPLKGPLMVRNIPAQDDVFFAKLDRKLESIKSEQDALPSVLRELSPTREPGSDSPRVSAQPQQPEPVPPPGCDISHDISPARESADEGESGEEPLEPDVPLKIRSTSNFGAPFGSA